MLSSIYKRVIIDSPKISLVFISILVTFFLYFAKNFNSDLSNWNVFNVTNMSDMFFNCNSFNLPLNNMDYMSYMFRKCKMKNPFK